MPGTRRTRSAARLAEAHALAQAERDPTLIPLPSLKEKDVAARALAARNKRDKLIADVPKALKAVDASSAKIAALEEQLKDARTKHARLEVALERKKAAVETQRQTLDALDGEHMRMVLERHGNDYSTMAGGGLCLRALAHLGSEELLGRMCVGLAWRRHSKVVIKERGDMKTIMMHGVDDYRMGKYVEDGEAHGFPRYKLCHTPWDEQYYLFRWTDGRWMVGWEGRIGTGEHCDIRSTTTDARLPLNLSWEKGRGNAWLPAEALETMDTIPPPPQSIVMQGRTGMHAHLMGVYDLEKKKKAHGMPLYKSRHTPVESGKEHAFLCRDSYGRWMVGGKEHIAKHQGWIKSATQGALLPLGLTWEWWDGEDFHKDEALTTTDIIPTPPQSIVMQGHTEEHPELMGVYDLERKKEMNGMPLYKSRHTPCGSGKHAFLYRSSMGRWMVGTEECIAKNHGCIESTTLGALLPLGLAWEWWDGEKWQKDEALTTTDIIPPPPQSIMMQGHTGMHAELMGVYDLEKKKKAHGMPLYKSRHTPCDGGKPAFLYRKSRGIWAVGKEESIAKNASWIKSTTLGALLPLGLAWDWYDGEESLKDEALTTTDIIPPPPQSIVMQGRIGTHAKLMGVYDLEKKKKAHGMPLYKSRHTPCGDDGGKHAFLYRDNDGTWVVGKEEDIATNNCWIISTIDGALSPVGLCWEWHDGTEWQKDAALKVSSRLAA